MGAAVRLGGRAAPHVVEVPPAGLHQRFGWNLVPQKELHVQVAPSGLEGPRAGPTRPACPRPQHRPPADPAATYLASQMTTTRALPPGGMSPLGAGSAACSPGARCSLPPPSAPQARPPGGQTRPPSGFSRGGAPGTPVPTPGQRQPAAGSCPGLQPSAGPEPESPGHERGPAPVYLGGRRRRGPRRPPAPDGLGRPGRCPPGGRCPLPPQGRRQQVRAGSAGWSAACGTGTAGLCPSRPVCS